MNSYLTISGSGSTLDSTPIESTDVAEYVTAYVATSVSPANGGADTVTGIFECSNDNITWFQVPALIPATPIAPTEILSFLYFVQGGSAATDTLYKVRLSGRYFRFRLNFYDGTGSTVTANAYIISADNQDAEVMTASRIVDYFGNYASVGQDTMSASLSVTLASDQILPLPTGASTSALQTTGNASLSSIDSKLGTLGQKTMAGSAPVVIASDQSDVPAKLGYFMVTGTSSGLNSTPVSFDSAGYDTVFVLLELVSGGGDIVTAVYEGSVDGVTWTTIRFTDENILNPPPTGSILETLVLFDTSYMPITQRVKVYGRYFRVRLAQYDAATAVIRATVYAIADDIDAETPSVNAALVDSGGNWITTLAVSVPAGASSIGKAEDSVALNADVGVPAMAVRMDSSTNLVSAQGDYAMLQLSDDGRLWTSAIIDTPLPAGTNSIGAVTQSGAWTTGRTWTLNSASDSVFAAQLGTWVLGANSGVDIGDVTVNNAGGASAVNVQTSGGNSLDVNVSHTTDSIRIGDGTDLALVTAAGELNVIATAQPGVDIGDVTINNAAGAAAVNIQDGGNSITVDGTVSASNFPTTVDTNYGTVGANTIRTAAQIGNATGAALFGAGTTTAQVLRVVLPTDQTVIPVQGQLTNNNAAPGATNVGVLPARATVAVPTYTEGNQVSLSTDLAGRLRSLAVPDLGILQTYSACASNLLSVASATDIFTITGSATKTIILTLLTLSGTATSATVASIDIVKRSSADTGGTSQNLVEVPNDSTSAAATATVLSYTANPTLGGTVGTVRSFKCFLPPPTGGNANTPSTPLLYPHTFSQGFTLRGTAQVLAINLKGVTITGGSFNIAVEWVEI